MQTRDRTLVLSFLIITILAVAAILSCPPPPLGLQKGKPPISKIQIKELEGALQLFRYDTARYPTTAEGLDALLRNPGNLTSWRGPYLSRSDGQDIPKDPWGRPYIYRCPGKPGAYDLFSYGRDGLPGGEGEDADIKSWEMTIPGR